MLKNFLRLFTLLSAVVILLIISVQLSINYLVSGNMSKEPENIAFHAPFFLIKRDLYSKPQSEWPAVIKELQTYYGYPLELKNIDDLDLNNDQKQQLYQNKILGPNYGILDDSEESDNIWYSTLKDSDLVILLYMSEPYKITVNRANKGIFYSFIKYMNEVPEAEWQNKFNFFQEQYGVKLQRLPVSDLNINVKQLNELKKGNIIGIDTGLFSFALYKNIQNTQDVLQLIPYGNSQPDNFLVNNYQFSVPVILALILAATLYLWMHPIWRDLNSLKSVTIKFGKGNFQLRSNLPKKSAIWDLSDTFNKMATRINNLLNSHKDLTNAVSHELRTPLSRLRFAIEMLNDEQDETLKQEFIDSMGIDIDELELLVSELLSYARFDRENPELKYCELNISEWLIEVIERIKSEQNTVNLQFFNILEDKSKYTSIDPKLIERALNNLIRNAIRYAKNRVDVSIYVKDNFYCISIEDDGIGIPEEDRKRILQPFFRIDSSRNRNTGGYGLGLSIVQQIIKWHKGKISISNSRYNGASFTLKLPIENNK